MSDLHDLAAYTRQPAARPSSSRRTPQASPLAQGFGLAVGAAPVLLAVILLAQWIGGMIAEQRAKAIMEDAARSIRMIQEATHAHSGKIGTDTGGTATYLQIGASSVQIGRTDGGTSGSGSTQIMLDTGSTTCAATVLATAGSGANTKYPPVTFKGDALTVVTSGGAVGVAVRPGETSTVSVRATKGASGSKPNVYVGAGATVNALNADSGNVYSQSDNTTAAATVGGDARYQYDGTGAHTALTVGKGSTCVYNGTGTVTTAVVRGTLDFAADARAKTVTTATVHAGATLNVDNGIAGAVTFTNPIVYPDGLDAAKVITPEGVKGTLVAI